MNATMSFTNCIRALAPFLDAAQKKRFVCLIVLALAGACLELGLTGLVALLAAIFASPEAVLQYPPIVWIQRNADIVLARDPRMLALGVLLAIVGTALVKNVIEIAQQYTQTAFSETLVVAIRSRLMLFFLRAPFAWFLQTGPTDLLFVLHTRPRLVDMTLMLLRTCSSVLMLLFLFTGLFAVSPLPSLLLVCVIGPCGFLMLRFARRLMDRYSQAVYRAGLRIHDVEQLTLMGMKEMRLCGREFSLFSVFSGLSRQWIRSKSRQDATEKLPAHSMELIGFGALVLVMLYLIFIQDAGIARIAGIMGFMAAAAWRTLPILSRLSGYLVAVRSGVPYLEKVLACLEQEERCADRLMPEPGPDEPAVSFRDRITVDQVDFSYPHSGQKSLHDVSLEIPRGTMVGIVGQSGAGKSTLVNVLTGLLFPDSGRVLVDGQAITPENARGWMRRIGYVAQSPYILDATLAENIALSRWGETLDRDRVLECCRMASLDFLDELEQGLDTRLGDHGARLSGGQAQRVAIARALYGNPDLIVFDEATSALDARNERAIQETIGRLRHHVTVVLIAHRLTSVEGCDVLLWLDKGMVREQGPAQLVLPRYKEVLRQEHAEEHGPDPAVHASVMSGVGFDEQNANQGKEQCSK